jgi:hypothetical protein
LFKFATEKDRVEGNLRSLLPPPAESGVNRSPSVVVAAAEEEPADLVVEEEPESVVDTLLRESVDFCLAWSRWAGSEKRGPGLLVSDNFLARQQHANMSSLRIVGTPPFQVR